MNPNEERQQKTHVVVDTPNEHREVITQRTETVPEKTGLSTGAIAIVAIVAVTIIGIVLYVISSKNQQSGADRNANLSAATLNSIQQPPPPTTVIQQPAPQQAPVIIQQAPAQQPQQAPVIIQQPAPSQASVDSQDDAATQAAATKKLNENDGMAMITVTMRRGTATLSGTASSESLKSKAEQVVRAVRGVSAVDNQIVIGIL